MKSFKVVHIKRWGKKMTNHCPIVPYGALSSEWPLPLHKSQVATLGQSWSGFTYLVLFVVVKPYIRKVVIPAYQTVFVCAWMLDTELFLSADTMISVRDEYVLPFDHKSLKGKFEVTCNHCKKKVRVTSDSTANYWSHLKRNHFDVYSRLKSPKSQTIPSKPAAPASSVYESF